MDNNKGIAWLNIEVASKEGSKGLSFQGVPCMTDYEAQENVSEVAICHFIAQMNILVNDLSYAAFRETFKQLHHYMSWTQLVQSRHETLRAQSDTLLSSHKSLLDRLGSICATHGDILALAPCLDDEKAIYTGPYSRYERLVQKLFRIVQEYTPSGNLEWYACLPFCATFSWMLLLFGMVR